MGNRDETVRFLQTIFAAGDVFEVRVLNASTADYQRLHAESGYFDYDHIPQAADAIASLRYYGGAYATLNPVNPALLARANNRLAPAKRDCSTADGDILARRWLPIDCDPDRPAGISSTDAEHGAALALAREIRDGLASLGWPEPMMLDSGNGAQMLYRVDLPTDDGGLVQKAIAEIAKGSNAAVHVDLSVFNPARIWRIPGTMNRKGDPIPDRPHRMAAILDVPKNIRAVTREQLASIIPGTPAQAEHIPASADGFDADHWVAEHCPELGTPVAWQGGRKWVFKVCPFNPAHDNSSAVLIQEASGAMAFKCHHNGCAGNDWRRLREMREPGCYDRPAQGASNIDWNGLLSKATPTEPAAQAGAPEAKDPAELPERLLHVPGFIDEYVDCAMASAPRPNRVISFCSALAFLSYATGRKIVSDRNTLPNIYLIALANSGVGKDHPRKVAMTLAVETGIAGGLAEDFKSGSGLEDALFLKPSILFQRDEIDTLFKILKMAKEENSETLMARLLNIYGSSNGSIKLRNLSMARPELLRTKKEMQANGREEDAAPLVMNPYLTVFGTAVPQFFFEALDRRMLANGMVARCLILDAGRRGPRQRSAFITIPESLKEAVKTIRDYRGNDTGNLAGVTRPSMRLLTATDGANRMLDELDERHDALYNECAERRDLVPMAFWARATEKVIKLSMLHAISSNVKDPLVTEDSVAWADEFTRFLTEQALFMAQRYSYENPFDEKCQKAVRYLTEAGGSYDHGALLKRMHESKETFQQIMDTLVESGSVTTEFQTTGGRTRKSYRLVGK